MEEEQLTEEDRQARLYLCLAGMLSAPAEAAFSHLYEERVVEAYRELAHKARAEGRLAA